MVPPECGEVKAPCPDVCHKQRHLVSCKIWNNVVLNLIKIKKIHSRQKTNLKLFFIHIHIHTATYYIANLVGHDLASSLEPLSLWSFTEPLLQYYNGRWSNGLHHMFLCSFTSLYCICPQSKYPAVLIQFLPTYCLTLEFTTCILLPCHL